MKERPILFNGAMVRAILDGSKTQTRRIVDLSKPETTIHDPVDGTPTDPAWPYRLGNNGRYNKQACPFGMPGDQLWVRETFRPLFLTDQTADIQYRANGAFAGFDTNREMHNQIVKPLDSIRDRRWRPSIHMPRWASRINLLVESVRVERLNSISEGDAMAEGVTLKSGGPGWCDPHIKKFRSLWESINGYGSWDLNPWVWVVEFSRMEGGDQ